MKSIMASDEIKESEIHIKISAENGEKVLKNEKIDIGNITSKCNDDSNNTQSPSYLSNLSATLKSLRHGTNSLLTEYIANNSKSNSQEAKENELSVDEDSSDDDNTG